MKRLILTAAGLLLLVTLCFTACDDSAPADTTTPSVPDVTTDAPTEENADTPTEAVTDDVTADTPTDTTTEAPTEPFTPPTADPTEAAEAGLPLDGNNYTLGGESSAMPKAQYDYLKTYAHAYADKSFTLYGNVMKNADGFLILSMGGDMEFGIYFDGVSEPLPGAYVKLTATFEQTVDKGDYVDFNCFTMMATACETLSEAQGPNGGKYMFITASSLNVRTSSDTSSSGNILGQLSEGDMVEVFEQDEKGWYRIIFNGQNAYISNKYVSETRP